MEAAINMNGNAESPKPDIEPSLRNILLLDKSTDPLGAQVDEACDILGISLSPSGHEPKPVGQVHCRYGSREEWTLRWLLRKLEGAGCETQR